MSKKLRKNKKNKKAGATSTFQKNRNTQQDTSLTPEQIYQFAVQYFQAGDLQQAEQSCEKLLNRDPENENANHLLGIILARQGGRNGLAANFIQKALAINPNNAEAHKNLAELFLEAGRLNEAVTSYQKSLLLDSEDVATLFNLGNVFQGLKNFDEATIAYKRALTIKPDYAEAYNNLGVALQIVGKHDEAIASYSQALSVNPNYAEALNNLGLQLQKKSKTDEAIDCYNKAIFIKSDYAEAYCNLGNALKELGKYDQATANYRKAISLRPDYIKAHNNLGLTLHKLKNSDEAVKSFKRALSFNPNFAETYNNLGVVLQDAGRFDEAKYSFEKALFLEPNFAEVYLNLGSVNHELGRSDKAIAFYKKALELDPDYADAFLSLGVVLNELGRLEEAKSYCKKALSKQPEHAEAFRHLSLMKKHTQIDDKIKNMEELYNRKGIENDIKMHLGFAFGKIYSDLKEYNKAFDYILEANRLRHKEYEFSYPKEKEFIENSKKIYSVDFFSKHQNTGNPDSSPIFIIGMPRSGTTLVEQIISSSSQVFGAGELKIFKRMIESYCSKIAPGKKYPECITDLDATVLYSMGSDYIKEIREYSRDAEYITNKMPHNFLFVGLIKIILPNAKIIHCTRNPMDNCLSIFKNVFRGSHNYAYDMVELGQYYNLYLDLMGHWEEVLPGYMFTIKYEEMVSDQENQSRRLLEFCGIPWDEACLSFHKTDRRVRTASLMQVRQPIYKDSVELWKRYEKQLEPLHKAIYGK